MRACDVVYGATSVSLGILALFEYFRGDASLGLVIALWAVPVLNLAWSFVTVHSDRIKADTIRLVCCVPLASYIYAAEANGVLRQMWLPALMVSVAIARSVVVDKHHGVLTFESELGRGTTFTIELPLAGVRAVA